MNESSYPAKAVFCVVPAAGLSSRMGEWKPLLPWGSSTVCGAVIDAVMEAGLTPVLVAGYRSGELRAVFSGKPGLTLVDNPGWERGMLGSVRAGASLVPASAPGFFVVPADMPRIPVRAFGAILSQADADTATGLPRAVFASKDGKLGHPVWIPRAFMAGLSALDPGSRLRDYLLGLSWTSVDIDDDGIFVDIDTPEAYIEARRSILTE